MEGFARIETILSSVPWLIVGFFINKLVVRIEEQAEIVAQLRTKLEVLVAAVSRDETKAASEHADLREEIEKIQEMQEMLRARTHLLLNKLTALKMKLETQKGIKFSEKIWAFSDTEKRAETEGED